MGYFKDILSEHDSLFKNEDALDSEFLPKVIPYRENQQQEIASCITPLLQKRNGKNLFIYGDPGIGKTAATRWVLRDLEENTDEVDAIYVNCWQKNSSYKIFVEVCHSLGYKFTQNKNTEEIFAIIRNIANKKAAVFVFDEIDKVEEFDFLYSILNDIYRKSVVLITNYKEWLATLEPRVKSRLMPETLEFKQYSKEEIKGILRQRVEYSFAPNVWNETLLMTVAEKTHEMGDIRAGIFILRESGLLAECKLCTTVLEEHVRTAIEKVHAQGVQKVTDLEEDTRFILDVVKEHAPKKIGDLFNIYKEKGGGGTYKTFQRKIVRLEKGKFISTNKIVGGIEGTTTIISYGKTLTEF